MITNLGTVQLVVALDPFDLGSREVSYVPAGKLADLVPNALRGRGGVAAFYEGMKVEPEDWAATDCNGGTLGFVILPGWLGAGITFWQAVGNFLISLAVGYIVSRLLAPSAATTRAPIENNDTTSSVYNFDGISNSRTEGIPLALVFGEIRYGGNIINEYIRSIGIPEESFLYQQISMGEGPIHSISGATEPVAALTAIPSSIQLDANSSDNFDDIEMWVRLGTNEQAVVPGFEATRVLYAAGFTLTASETSGTLNSLANAGYSGADWDTAVNDPVWAAHGVAVDIDISPVDSAIARLSFERGLFTQNSSTGSLEDSHYAYQARYQELTPAGVPITTGGPLSDGWVRMPPVGPIPATSSGQFAIEAPILFEDIQTWEPPIPGQALYGEATTIPTGIFQPASSYTYHISFWFKLDVMPSTDRHLFRYEGSSGNADRAITVRPDGTIGRQSSATSSGNYVLDSPPNTIAAGQWYHVACDSDIGAGAFSRLWVNGGQVASNSSPWPLPPIDVTYYIGGSGVSMDQLVIYGESHGGSVVLADYNQGRGRATYTQGPGFSYLCAVRFDDPGPPEQDPAAGGTGTFAAFTLVGGATSGIATGKVPDPDIPIVNTPKRSRYRVEVLRTNVDSTNVRVADNMAFTALIAVTDSELTYPNTPLLGLRVGATDQLSGSAPNTTAVIKGLLTPVWDGVSTLIPAVSLEWAANPAWVTLGLLTNGRWGLGQTYSVQDCVSQSLLDWANYCDDTVYSGSAQFSYATPTSISEDVLFTKDTTDPDDRGVITFNIRKTSTGSTLPLDWVVGAKLRAHGFPVPNVTDINQGALGSTAAGGYEIFGIQGAELSANKYWLIKCYWDRLEFEADPWTSGTYLSAAATIPITATIELGEPRHEFNGVFDREQTAWDAILEVCQVGRAMAIREGSKVRFKFQHPRSPVGLVTSANIVSGTFGVSYSDGSMLPNAIDATISDKAQDYEMVPITILDPAIGNVLSLDEVRKVSRNYFGITSATQAERQARLELNMNRLLRRGGKFTLGPEGLPFEVGDLVRLGADLLPRGDGGRALRASLPGTGYKLEMIADPIDFTAWTASNVAVTANTVANPYGTAPDDADKVQDSGSNHGYVEATGTVSGSDLNAEWLSFGVYIKPGAISSNKSLVSLVLSGGVASYFCDWTTETIYASQFATLPEDMRSAHIQKLGTSGWYFVQVAGFHETKTSAAAAPIVRVFPASNTASVGAETGIVELYNGRMSYGQWAAPGGPGISARIVTLDRDLTLADGVHKVYGRDYVDNLAEGTLDSTLCPAGAYTTGDILITSAVMGTALQEESSWMVVKSGDELVVEISSSSLTQDMTRECEWVEYNEAVYDDVAGMTSTSPLLGFTTGADLPLGIDPAVNGRSMPGDTTITGTRDVLVRQAPGQFVTTIYLGLMYDQPTKWMISRTEIFWRVVAQDAAGWALAGGTTGLDSTAIIQIPNAQPGQTIELTANSITQMGRRRKPGRSLRVQVPLRGLTAPPETPTDLTRKLSQRQAVYGYTVSGEDLLAVEIRRGGGWILGQLVSREAASQRAGTRSSEPTSNWAGSTTDTPTLLYAAQNAAGAYGVPATTTWSPTPDADSLPSDATRPDQAWESWDAGGNGWQDTVPAVGEPFIGPEFEQATAGSLGYTAASTSVAWETVYTTQRDSGAALTLEQDRQPRAAFLEAWVDAEASSHVTWDGGTWEISDMLEDRWTWEGPRYTTPGETANPELVIEVRINIDGTTAGWGSWQEYKPGIYRIVDAQFRLRARRHNTGQNIIVAKLHTRITPPRLSLEETTPAQSLLHGETF